MSVYSRHKNSYSRHKISLRSGQTLTHSPHPSQRDSWIWIGASGSSGEEIAL